MKKVINLILSMSGISIISSSNLLPIGCSSSLTQSDYINMYKKYYNNDTSNPYAGFLIDADNILSASNNPKENQKFDALYDDGRATNFWDTYSNLQWELTNNKLSSDVTTNINWENLYSKVGLDSSSINTALKQQLRFYNILAKLYGRSNILKLLEWVRLAPKSQPDVIAYNTYYPQIASQTQTYGQDFANINLIYGQYLSGFWTTGELTSVSTHEYGHALSNFLSASKKQRSNFNTTYISPATKNLKLSTASSYSDRTQILINFLDEDAINKHLITIDNDIENFLFALKVVFSGYSQSAWVDSNDNERDEFFAEAFAYWMLTPENIRDIRWDLLNDFFIDYVPIYYEVI